MHYLTIIRYRPRTTEAELSTLVDQLEATGCRVRRDPLWTQLYVEVPGTLKAWLEEGGMEALLAAFREMVAWTRHVAERGDSHDVTDDGA